MSVLAFMAASCRVNKDNNIHVNHAKEKDQFKISKKYKPAKKCKTWK